MCSIIHGNDRKNFSQDLLSGTNYQNPIITHKKPVIPEYVEDKSLICYERYKKTCWFKIVIPNYASLNFPTKVH